MEIKEFQSLVVSQIIESTKELNKKYGKNTIATKEVHSYGENNKGRYIFGTDGNRLHCIEVEIDIAVTVMDAKSTESGAKISVASLFNVGGEKNKTVNNETTNRIRYTIPVIIPTDE